MTTNEDPVTRLLVVVAGGPAARKTAETVIEATLAFREGVERGFALDAGDERSYSVGRWRHELTARGVRTVGVPIITLDDAVRLGGAILRPEDVIVADPWADPEVLAFVLTRIRRPA